MQLKNCYTPPEAGFLVVLLLQKQDLTYMVYKF